MPSSRDSFRRNRVAPVVKSILPLLEPQCLRVFCHRSAWPHLVAIPSQSNSVALANTNFPLIDNPNRPSENQTRGLSFLSERKPKMTPDSSSMDQAVSRAIRSNLESLQRQSEELHQAVADLISACGSSRPANALSATLRAQSTAASLGASLEVLGRFIASVGQSSRRGDDYSPREMETVRAVPAIVHESPAPSAPVPMSAASAPISEAADISSAENNFSAPPPTTIDGSKYDSAPVEEFVEDIVEEEQISEVEAPELPQQEFPVQESIVESHAETFAEAPSNGASTTDTGAFDVASLPQDQQEMHRRANRVAKVSMQDIQLLKPKQVQEGREQHDICIRLKDEIGKARKEYERRFQPILGHGVDYFYHWMVEVLGKGDPETLGEYPYSSQPVQQ
jgi:hypothetical protein